MNKSKYTLAQIDELLEKVEKGEVASSVSASDLDFSNWDNGTFSGTMTDGSALDGSVAFDENNRPTSITVNGKTLTLTFPE